MTSIYTIGYGNRTTEVFLTLLKQYNIDVVVDVRSQPVSKYNLDFTKQRLSRILNRARIRYEFMGDLLGGRPDDKGCFSYSAKRKTELLDPRKCETKDSYIKGISRLKAMRSPGRRIALMCSELEPERCHRGYVIGKTLEREDVDVVHIDRDGAPKPQADIPDMIYQPALL